MPLLRVVERVVGDERSAQDAHRLGVLDAPVARQGVQDPRLVGRRDARVLDLVVRQAPGAVRGEGEAVDTPQLGDVCVRRRHARPRRSSPSSSAGRSASGSSVATDGGSNGTAAAPIPRMPWSTRSWRRSPSTDATVPATWARSEGAALGSFGGASSAAAASGFERREAAAAAPMLAGRARRAPKERGRMGGVRTLLGKDLTPAHAGALPRASAPARTLAFRERFGQRKGLGWKLSYASRVLRIGSSRRSASPATVLKARRSPHAPGHAGPTLHMTLAQVAAGQMGSEKPPPPATPTDADFVKIGKHDFDWDLDPTDPAMDYAERYIQATRRYGTERTCVHAQLEPRRELGERSSTRGTRRAIACKGTGAVQRHVRGRSRARSASTPERDPARGAARSPTGPTAAAPAGCPLRRRRRGRKSSNGSRPS